jgi:urea transport system ATP-binding protein
MLAVKDLSFAYGEVQILRNVTLDVPQNQIVCVMGRNGVGKTTLMNNIMGLSRPFEGTISINGQEIVSVPAHKRARLGLGYVPQGRMIFPKLTVIENLRVGLSARSDGQKRIPDEVYDLFPILKEMAWRRGGDLSGGQQQQLAIGRALVGDPKILILDEPTEGIQPNIIQEIGRVLKMLVEERGMTVVMVEQYFEFVKEFGHYFYLMNRGQIVEQGNCDELTDELASKHLSV